MSRGEGTAFPMKRLKYLVALRRLRTQANDGARPYVGLEDIESGTGRLTNRVTASSPSASSVTDESDRLGAGKSHGRAASSVTDGRDSLGADFERGDVLFGKLRPYLAKAWVAEFAGRCTTEALVMKPLLVEPRFLRDVCLSSRFVGAVDASTFGSKMPRAEWDFIGNLPVPVPDPGTQRAIADYLDRETARLDALVAAKERLLALLAEKRRALVTRAVTRGLDPRVPTRDSGVPWLGEIPAHWEIWKIGHVASVGNGSTPSRNRAAYWTDGTIPWLNSSAVNRPEVTDADQFVTALAVRQCHLPLVKAGSVLVAITGQGKTRGRAVVSSIDSTINQHLAFIRPDGSRLRSWFLRWTLLAAYDFLRSISDDAGGTKGALTCEDVADLRVPVPPSDEQAVILIHIASFVERVDSLRAATKDTILLIKERRAALITAAVIGQTGHLAKDTG